MAKRESPTYRAASGSRLIFGLERPIFGFFVAVASLAMWRGGFGKGLIAGAIAWVLGRLVTAVEIGTIWMSIDAWLTWEFPSIFTPPLYDPAKHRSDR